MRRFIYGRKFKCLDLRFSEVFDFLVFEIMFYGHVKFVFFKSICFLSFVRNFLLFYIFNGNFFQTNLIVSHSTLIKKYIYKIHNW